MASGSPLSRIGSRLLRELEEIAAELGLSPRDVQVVQVGAPAPGTSKSELEPPTDLLFRIDVPWLRQLVTLSGTIKGHYVAVGRFQTPSQVERLLNRLDEHYDVHVITYGSLDPDPKWIRRMSMWRWAGLTICSAARRSCVRIGRESRIRTDRLSRLAEIVWEALGAEARATSGETLGATAPGSGGREISEERVEEEIVRLKMDFALGRVGLEEYEERLSELEEEREALRELRDLLERRDFEALRARETELRRRLEVLDELSAQGRVSRETYEETARSIRRRIALIEDILRGSGEETEVYGE